MKKLTILLIIASCFSGCFYIRYNQKDVAIKNVDIDATLKIAAQDMSDGKKGDILTLWAIRDQVYTPLQAKVASDLYLQYVDSLKDDFSRWHYAWAITDIYRNGNSEIKTELEKAYNDGIGRVNNLKKFRKVAKKLTESDKIYMGDIHFLGRAYAKRHVVAPGNKKYLQSVDEYMKKRAKKMK